jgi:TPP-dependent trihydroxycyclohexane-1,2-dione (THcHDO) dehydratase
MLGMHGCYEANMAMHNADVIFAVGARFDDRVTNNPAKFCPNAKVFILILILRPFLKLFQRIFQLWVQLNLYSGNVDSIETAQCV